MIPVRRVVAGLIVSGLCWPGVSQETKPMAPGADPSYEVATIKPSDPANTSSGFQTRGPRIIVLNETVDAMLVFAFGVQQRQLIDSPTWTGQSHYDVNGIADTEGQPDVQQMRSMVRKLLKSRFHLQFHEAQREMPVYVLSVAKSGSKLAKSTSKDGFPDQTGNNGTSAMYHFTNNSMADFTGFLQFELDRPVLNETALAERYDFTLRWTPELSDKPVSDDAPPMFRALQEQLGLKIEPARRNAPVMVIDHLERPAEN